MNKIIIVGARGGSVRVINKNLRIIGDTLLIEYTMNLAKKLGYPIYVSSDSDLILSKVSEYPKTTVIKRPSELASNTATDMDWIRHLLLDCYKTNGLLPAQLIFLRPTTPFRDLKVVEDAIKKFDPDRYTSLRSVHELKESSYKTFIIKNGSLKGFNDDFKDQPNHLVPVTYSGNGYVDILVTKQIFESNTLYGNCIMPFVTESTVEIDTEEDIEYANFILERKK